MPDYDAHPETGGRQSADGDGRAAERFDQAPRGYYTLRAEGFPLDAVAVLMLMREGWLAGLRGGPNDGAKG